MKKILFVGLFLAFGLQIGYSQSYDINRSEKNKNFAMQMNQPFIDWSIQTMGNANTLLALTDEQQDEIVYINLMFAKRMQILQDKGMSPEELNNYKTDMVTMAVNNYERVLDDSQKAILNEDKEALIELGIK